MLLSSSLLSYRYQVIAFCVILLLEWVDQVVGLSLSKLPFWWLLTSVVWSVMRLIDTLLVPVEVFLHLIQAWTGERALVLVHGRVSISVLLLQTAFILLRLHVRVCLVVLSLIGKLLLISGNLTLETFFYFILLQNIRLESIKKRCEFDSGRIILF